MPITIAGSGTITGISAGGLPDGVITTDDIAAAAVTSAKLAAGAGGKILQVVQTVKTDTFSTASNTFTAVTGLSVSITPSSTSNKILIYTSFVGATNSATGSSAGVGRFMRDSTPIGTGTAVGSRSAASFGISTRSAGVSIVNHTVGHFLDSPNTISSITYSVQVLVGAGTLYIGRNEEDADVSNLGRYPSVITLMEVAA